MTVITLGERIYALRTAKNLSQGDLAEQLDAVLPAQPTAKDAASAAAPAKAKEWSDIPSAALTAEDKQPALFEATYTPVDELVELVKDQIEYDVLCTRDNPQPLLDCAVEVISRILHMPPGGDITIKGAHYSAFEVQRALSTLDANEAEYAIQAAHGAIERARERGTPVRNVRSYLLACLFTAKTDFATSLVY